MCAKLSTCGRIPTAKFIAMMKISVNNAAACTNGITRYSVIIELKRPIGYKKVI